MLVYHRLRKASVDAFIIAELGGEAAAETTLAGVHGLMTLQPHGQEGALLTNGLANIFYVRDRKGVLRAVYVAWHGGGWSVSALSVEYPGRWDDGSQIFSRILVFSNPRML